MSNDASYIFIIGLNYAPEPTGNAPYTASLSRYLADHGHRVEVLTAHPHYPEWKVYAGYGGWRTTENDAGVHLTRLSHYVPRRPRGIRRLLSEISFGLRAIAHRWGQPDTIVLVSPALFSTAIAMARARLSFKRRNVVVWVQDLYSVGLAETSEGGRLVQRVTKAVEGWTFRHADRVIVIHTQFAKHVTEELGVSPGSVSVIPNWSHLTVVAGDHQGTRQYWGWGENLVVLHAGNMGVKQGLTNVVSAARLAREQGLPVRFVLMGDGNARADLVEHGRGLSTLQFIPPQDDAGFQHALAAADILLVNELPGVANMAVPSKLTSYFSSGTPVLAAVAKDGTTAEVLTGNELGEVVPSGDPQALLSAVVALLRDNSRAQEYAQRAHAYWEDQLSKDAALANFAALLFTSDESSRRTTAH